MKKVQEKKERLPRKKRQSGFTVPDDIQDIYIEKELPKYVQTTSPSAEIIAFMKALEEALPEDFKKVEVKTESVLFNRIRQFVKNRSFSSSAWAELAALAKSTGETGLSFLFERILYDKSPKIQKFKDSYAVTLCDYDNCDSDDYDMDSLIDGPTLALLKTLKASIEAMRSKDKKRDLTSVEIAALKETIEASLAATRSKETLCEGNEEGHVNNKCEVSCKNGYVSITIGDHLGVSY